MQNHNSKFKIIKNFTLSFFILTFTFYIPLSVHAGWFDTFKSAAGLVQGFSGIPGLSGSGGATGAEVPVFNRAIEEIKKKEVGTKKINIPGVGSVSLPVPGASGSLDGIAYQLARMALNKITKDIVSWIKGGGRNGKPLFVTNWEDFLKNVANEASGIFIEELELTEICKPFKPRIQLLIGGGKAPYYQRARCTIEDVANNVERFYANFKQGGWTRWFQITMVPQNNFYGAYYLSLEEKLIRESTALEAKQSEAIAGGGFLGQEKCAEWKKPTYTNPEDDPNFYPGYPGEKPVCLKYETITPGTLIQDQLEEVFSSDIRQLELADEIDEIIGAAFQRLLSNMRGKALNGTKQGVTSQAPINQFIDDTRSEVPAAIQQVSNTLELPQAITLSQQTAGIKQDSISKANSLVGVFGNINSCQTGSGDSRIAISESNITQLEKDIQNINTITAQLTAGEQELAKAESTDVVYQLYSDLRSAIDIVISLYDSAIAENNQIAGEIASAEQELETCQGIINE